MSDYQNINLHNEVAEQLRSMGLPSPYETGSSGGSNFSGGLVGTAGYESGRSAYGNREFFRQATADDNTAKRLATGTADAIYGKHAGTDAYYADIRRYTQMFGAATNSPFIAGLGGGSSNDLAFGIQNAVVGSGMRVNGMRTFGGGALTDAMALDVHRDIQKNFFNGSLGSGNLQKTFGFDKTEVGQMFSLMQQRGSFNNMFEGEMTEDGGVRATAGTSAKITRAMENAAKTLGILKDIFGATKNMAQLFNIAENVGGVDFADTQSMDQFRRRVLSTTSRAMATGFSPRAAFEYEARSAEAFRSLGYSRTSAGVSAGFATGSAMEQFSAYDQMRGIGLDPASGVNVYLPKMDMAAYMGNSISLTDRMVRHSESSPALLATHLLQSGSITKEQQQILRSALSDTSQSGILGITTALNKIGVNNIGSEVALLGGNKGIYNSLSASGVKQFNDYTANVLGRRTFDELISSSMLQTNLGIYGKGVSGNYELASSTLKSVTSQLSSDTQMRIAGGGDYEALIKGDVNAELSEAAQTKMISAIQQLNAGSEDGNGFGRLVATAQNWRSRYPGMGISEGDKKASALRELDATAIFDNLNPRGGALSQFYSGLSGGVAPSSKAMMEFLRETDPESMSFVQDGDSSDKLRTTFSGLDKDFLSSTLANYDRASGAEKSKIFTSLILAGQAGGFGVARQEGGGFHIASAERIKKLQEQSVLQRTADAEALDDIRGGADKSSAKDYANFLSKPAVGLDSSESYKAEKSRLDDSVGVKAIADYAALAAREDKGSESYKAEKAKIDARYGDSAAEYAELAALSDKGSEVYKSRKAKLDEKYVTSAIADYEKLEARTDKGSESYKAEKAKIADRYGSASAEYEKMAARADKGSESYKSEKKKFENLYGEKAWKDTVVNAAVEGRSDKISVAFNQNKAATSAALNTALAETQRDIVQKRNAGVSTEKAEEREKSLKTALSQGADTFLGKLVIKMGSDWWMDLFQKDSPQAAALTNFVKDANK